MTTSAAPVALAADDRAKLIDALRAGVDRPTAAQYVGLEPSALTQLLASTDLLAEVESAEAAAKVASVGGIARAAKGGDWRAAAFLLDRKPPRPAPRHDPDGSSTRPGLVPGASGRKPSLTRAASNRRQRLVEEARRGNTNALRHGVFAVVANQGDVRTEVELIYAANSYLDPIADHRLVEELALSLVQRRRALIAIEAEGMTSTLTSYESRLAALVERGEARIHERDRQRRNEARSGQVVDLTRYRPGASQIEPVAR